MTIPLELQAKIREAKQKKLTELNLNDYQLKEIPPEVFDLTQLKVLNLSRNELNSLPESIENLSALSSLKIIGNQLSCLSLPQSIGNLSNLTELDLTGSKIRYLPESIGNLFSLNRLYLNRNELKTVPESISNLSLLNQLDLSNNKFIIDLPLSISNLHNLTWLNVNTNYITNLPNWIDNLTRLICLDLSENLLTRLPQSIGNLHNLTYLNLSYNKLKKLPKSIGNLTNLTHLYLDDNPLKNPPVEIRQKGTKAVIEYFRKVLEEGYDTIYEAKFIIVGEGEAGKTSLMNKILDPNYLVPQPEKATHGIDIRIFNFPLASPFLRGTGGGSNDDLGGLQTSKQFRVNIWDFGGQEIYHQTHQFFLTKRSLYALVTDSRKDHIHLDYWLQIVELLSESSPMLIIKNEKDCCVDIKDEAQIRTRFKTMVQEILDTNLATNTGLERIVNRMQEYIAELPHVGIKIPKTWAKVRKAIEDDKRDYISLDDYLKICDDCGYTKTNFPTSKDENERKNSLPTSKGGNEGEKSLPTFQGGNERGLDGRLILSQFLHDLGIILHFQDEEESPLYKTVILNPTWGTQAVYELLKKENNPVKNNLGKFTFQDLKIIWSDGRYNGKYRELLELMKRFKLCYQLPNVKPNIYIAPQLLNTNAPNPKYDWNPQDNLRLNYHYEFMPKGILSRFIVEMHPYIEEPKVWRYGVILTYQNTRAEIIETYNSREILIRIEGQTITARQELLHKITVNLDSIHDSYHRLKVDKLIPCNCDTCKNSQTPYFHRLKNLNNLRNKNKSESQCQESGEMVKIDSLIDGTIGRGQFNSSNLGKYNPTIVIGDNMQDNRVYQKHTGRGDINRSGDIIGRDKNITTTNIYNSQNLTESAKEIKALLDELDQEYNNSALVGAKAIEKIENNPSLKARFIKALKEGGTEALNQLINHPACSIVLAAGKGFIDAE